MLQCDLAIAHMFVDVVVAYINVFGLLVSFGWESKCDGRGIVTVECGWEGLVQSDLPQKWMHP